MRKSLLLLLLFSSYQLMAQQTDTIFLKKLMQDKPKLFAGILNHPNKNEVQIIYTQVNRDQKNKPNFKTFSYNLNPTRYFYPASTVKLAGVIFALEKLNELKIKGLTAQSKMITDSSFKGQTKVLKDETAQNGEPSIAHYAKKILLTSDNDAFNRLAISQIIAETLAELKLKFPVLPKKEAEQLAACKQQLLDEK